jgi:Domain of unknown function (DUF4260)
MVNTSISPSRPAIRFSMPSALLRIEGLVVFGSAIALYAQQGYSWWAFALLLLAPDLAFVAALIGPRAGGIAYNLAHTYSFPLLLALISLAAGGGLGLQLALIWAAHIGMDRTVGYGLKYLGQFKETHLSRV